MGHFRKYQIAISMTNRCNLQCVYCYTDDAKTNFRPLKVNLEFAETAIKDFFLNMNGSQLRFYGIGEPTQAFEEMKHLWDYTKKLNSDLTSELQTNGVFTDEIAHWVGTHIDKVWISIDGPPRIQNKLRPSINGTTTSFIIENNINIIKQYDKSQIGLRATINNLNVSNQMELIDYAKFLQINAVYVHHAFKQQGVYFVQDGSDIIDVDLEMFVNEYLKAFKYAQKQQIFLGNFLTINFDEEIEVNCRSCIPCPYVTLDGYISCCDEGYFGSDKRFKELIYGKWIESEKEIVYFQDKIDYLNSREIGNLHPECEKCSIVKHCAGGCMGESNFQFGNIFTPDLALCRARKKLAKNLPLNSGLDPYLHP